MAAGDVTITQDGGGNVKLHPYVVALVRWCVSCVWSAATLLLHRILVAPRPAITAARCTQGRSRPASSAHIHPEPLVHCQLLHQPATTPEVDFIFIHGLYGSLENTWRQGDWRSKYKISPNKIPLRRTASIPTPCSCEECKHFNNVEDKIKGSDGNSKGDLDINSKDEINGLLEHFHNQNTKSKEQLFEENIFTNIDEREYYKNKLQVLPNDEIFVNEKFFNKYLNQVNIVDNYEIQAQFVRDLFNRESLCDSDLNCGGNDKARNDIESDKESNVGNETNETYDQNKYTDETNPLDYRCECNECSNENDKRCDVGCGCICDKCYSTCWPKDWLSVDFPNARVISINYTSDPYLWRPLWKKEHKRLRLHERAEQMTRQLLDLGVGERPIVWVGHSKGGLFIKQIYCEAYEAYLKTTAKSISNINENCTQNIDFASNLDKKLESLNCDMETEDNKLIDIKDNIKLEMDMNKDCVNMNSKNDLESKMPGTEKEKTDVTNNEMLLEEDIIKYSLKTRSSLWCKSAGFMFYSVPHRGSSLADIKTPITARSIELLEISKDNALVLSLQERWLRATGPSQPVVRSLVETNRTLMSVLWLKIVSVESADAGIGALCGISVDHREICKPSSRTCILYKELQNLIHAAVTRWRCNTL